MLDKKPFSNELRISEILYKKGFHLAAGNKFVYVHGDELATSEIFRIQIDDH